MQFLNQLNNIHPTIKFMEEHSNQSVNYLDLKISKATRFSKTNILDLQLYHKQTNTFNCLHSLSAHPKHTLSAIVKGELIRIMRLSSAAIHIINTLML